MFKLYLAPDNAEIPDLPEGLTPRRVITDYISNLLKFIIKEIRQKLGHHILYEDIQWCLTVPAIWDDSAKQEMRTIFQLIKIDTEKLDDTKKQNPLIILEPEAASVYCLKKFINAGDFNLDKPFLIADIGGGTVDIVVHRLETSSEFTLQEVSKGSGGLCGGIYVDQAFNKHISQVIGDAYSKFELRYPRHKLKLMSSWENIKRTFTGAKSQILDLPGPLAILWDSQHTRSSEEYFEHEMTADCLKHILIQ
jgi:molecular chaperone DnaK (HSP70)